MKSEKKIQGNIWGLAPMMVFLLLYLGTGFITGDFNSMPVNVAFIISAIVGILMNKKIPLKEKIESFCKGAGDQNIILMGMIFLLAGGFANVAKEMGAITSTVNLGLSILPGNILVAGLFIIGCFISLSIGTSMGTIVSLTPIALGLSEQTGITLGICVGAIVGGAMFGDNLSMLSDTTIAATKTQDCDMKDKFKANIKIILPAAILTGIILTFVTAGTNVVTSKVYEYSLIKVLPYIGVLGLALSGINVLVVLVISIIFAGGIGLYTGDFTPTTLLKAISSGVIGMEDLFIISLLIGGLVGIIKLNKGLDYLIHFVGSRIKGKRGAELGIAFLIAVADICTGNNTIAIIMVGPLAKDIAEEYGIDKKRSASLLDTFSCAVQGMIPYGAQLLAAGGLAGISSFEIMKYNIYPYLMFISALFVIFYGTRKENTRAYEGYGKN
ncbi:putative methionine transporter, NhaC family (TC 2.A.35.1.-) [Cetobacterium ceti]|uniref:Putative methionine transporter, NhaC family (TC 2.A.35.1.-) n=1 Tax=Cetobacterium ceti TaxID=180163 RepID=A0A1T4MEV6_9FUSO|nr:Na+/H+ antiporter NhaC family protein [Cetobacterium ceti]SJZ65472.1 putative methionine transporter, NhaC family (TC 2.A.35.1.-) [Cetobacterium ceti]